MSFYRLKRMLAIAVMGCAPMLSTGCPFLDLLSEQVADVLDRDDDTFLDEIGDLIDSIRD